MNGMGANSPADEVHLNKRGMRLDNLLAALGTSLSSFSGRTRRLVDCIQSRAPGRVSRVDGSETIYKSGSTCKKEAP